MNPSLAFGLLMIGVAIGMIIGSRSAPEHHIFIAGVFFLLLFGLSFGSVGWNRLSQRKG